jgi:hypothetical protein
MKSFKGKMMAILLACAIIIPSTIILVRSGSEVRGDFHEIVDSRSIIIEDDLEYIAIGEKRFEDELRPLLQWKIQKGIKSAFFPLDGIDGILANHEGRDRQERIRNFINSTWQSTGGNGGTLKWILLAGDGEIIPARRTFVNISSENGADDPDNYVMSDLYYAGLSTNWDEDGDGVFGEEGSVQEMDAIAEVYVGRFPASNEKELTTMVSRQLSYERDPVPGSWMDSMLLAGSLMDAPNNQALFDPYKDNAFELVTKVDELLPEDVSTFKLLDYPRLEWGGYNRMFDTLNETSFRDHFETGFSTVLLACHGDRDGNCTHYQGDSGGNYPYWADYGVYFNYTTAETISNGGRTPFVYISNCDSLNFSEVDDTNMERLMKNEQGGAIGVIGASVTTYRGEYFDDTSWGNWWLAEEFFEILHYNTSRPGEALYKLKEDYVNHINTKDLHPSEIRMFNIDNLAYNLLGDPEGPLWLGTPGNLEVEYPERFYQDNTSVQIKVSDRTTGAFIKGARICLLDPDNSSIYEVRETNNVGEVIIPLSMNDLGELTLTVTKEGYLPSVNEMDVVSLRNIRIVGTPKLDPEVPVFDDPFTVTVSIENEGDVVLEGVTAQARLTSPVTSTMKTSPAKSQQTGFRLLPGEIVNQTISFDSPLYNQSGVESSKNGLNFLLISIEIPPGPLESDLTDNNLEMQFRANIGPSLFGMSSGFNFTEDSRLTDKMIVDLNDHYIDDNYPLGPSYAAEVISGQLEATILEGGILEIIPRSDWYGPGKIRVLASDGSQTTSRTLNIVVDPVPDPPAFVSWPDTVAGFEDIPLDFIVEIVDVDSSEENLTLSAPGKDNVTFQRIENETSMLFRVNLTPGVEDLGPSVLVMKVTDGHNLSAEVRINLETGTTNDPPEAEFDPDISVEKGSIIEIPMVVTDPDNDPVIMVGATGPIVRSYEFSDGILRIVPLEGLEKGTYTVNIWVDDNGTRGNRTYEVDINIVEKENDPIFLTFIILVLVIIIILIAYGVFVRSQESRQRKMLDRVGDEVLLSKKGRSRKRRKDDNRKGKAGSIKAPPVPSEVEGDLARRGIEEIEAEDWDDDELEEITAYQDLESELEEVLDELYPGSEAR